MFPLHLLKHLSRKTAKLLTALHMLLHLQSLQTKPTVGRAQGLAHEQRPGAYALQTYRNLLFSVLKYFCQVQKCRNFFLESLATKN